MRKANRIGGKIYRKGLSADSSFLFCRKLRQRESPQEECGAFFETGALSPDFLWEIRLDIYRLSIYNNKQDISIIYIMMNKGIYASIEDIKDEGRMDYGN